VATDVVCNISEATSLAKKFASDPSVYVVSLGEADATDNENWPRACV